MQTAEFAAVGATALLEAIRAVDPSIRFYQASSSEIFGEPRESPQTEETPLAPVTPYGVAKAYAHFIVHSYRRRYGLFACSGILYNHESPRRPLEFLPRKVAHGAAAISLGLQDELVLGDLDAPRDWGYAGDYVRAMWLMLQQDEPGDYVVASGESHSVRELVAVRLRARRARLAGARPRRSGAAARRGGAAPARRRRDRMRATRLGWQPELGFEQLVHLLVDADLERLRAPATSMERMSDERRLTIDGVEIHDGSACYVIAEIGHNHQGSLEQAKRLVDAAKECGADAVKLQKRSNRALYTREFFEQPYDNELSFGRTYGEHREALELGRRRLRELQRYAREVGITLFATRVRLRERRPARRARRAGVQVRVGRPPQHAAAAARRRVRQADASLDRRRDDGGRRSRGRRDPAAQRAALRPAVHRRVSRRRRRT